MTMSSTSNGHKPDDIQLFVLSGTEAPELQELKNLPEAVKLLGTGRPDKECKSRLTGLTALATAIYCYNLVCRLEQAGLEQSRNAPQMWNGERCIDKAGVTGAACSFSLVCTCTTYRRTHTKTSAAFMQEKSTFVYQPYSRAPHCLQHFVSRFWPV